MKNIMKKIDFCAELIGGIAFVLLILLTMANMISDWTVGKRFAEFDELVQSFFVWTTYIAMGVLYKNGEQIEVNFFVNMLSEKIRKIILIFVDVFSLLICSIMFYLSYDLAVRSITKTTAVLKLPYVFIDMALVIGFFLTDLNIVIRLASIVKGGKKDD